MIKAILNKVPKLWLVIKCLAIGYVAGSIHAPFGIEWRKDSALPSANSGFDILELPSRDLDIEAIDDDLKG